MGNVTVWKQHFNLLEETIDKIGLRNNLKSMFNCHKSMVAINRQSGTVVVSRKTKHTYSGTKGTRDYITVNACVSASGFIMPLHIIFSQAYYLLPMPKMDLMELYIKFLIMATWIENFFMVSSIDYLFHIQRLYQDQSYLYLMDMGRELTTIVRGH